MVLLMILWVVALVKEVIQQRQRLQGGPPCLLGKGPMGRHPFEHQDPFEIYITFLLYGLLWSGEGVRYEVANGNYRQWHWACSKGAVSMHERQEDLQFCFPDKPRGANGCTCMGNCQSLFYMLPMAFISYETWMDCSVCETQLPPSQTLILSRAKCYQFIHMVSRTQFWQQVLQIPDINKITVTEPPSCAQHHAGQSQVHRALQMAQHLDSPHASSHQLIFGSREGSKIIL